MSITDTISLHTHNLFFDYSLPSPSIIYLPRAVHLLSRKIIFARWCELHPAKPNHKLNAGSIDWPKTNNADADLRETMFPGTMFAGLSFLLSEKPEAL